MVRITGNHGFSILQVIIAATVLTGIVGTLTGNFYNQQKENKFYAIKAEEEELLRQLTNILKDQTNCTHNFENLSIHGGTRSDIQLDRTGTGVFKPLYTIGETLKRRGTFQIKSYELSDNINHIRKAFKDPGIDANINIPTSVVEKLASLNVTFLRESKDIIGAEEFVGKIPLVVQTHVGVDDLEVVTCGSLITNYDSQWEMIPDSNDIAFSKKIATGAEVDNAGATMQVEKSAYIEQNGQVGGELDVNGLVIGPSGELVIPKASPSANDDGTIWIN